MSYKIQLKKIIRKKIYIYKIIVVPKSNSKIIEILGTFYIEKNGKKYLLIKKKRLLYWLLNHNSEISFKLYNFLKIWILKNQIA